MGISDHVVLRARSGTVDRARAGFGPPRRGCRNTRTTAKSARVKALLVLTATLAAVIVGTTGGLLARWDGATVPACIMRGSVAFGVSVSLSGLMLTSLGAFVQCPEPEIR